MAGIHAATRAEAWADSAASPQSRNPARGQQYVAEDRGRSSSNSWFWRSLAGGEAGGRLLLSRSVELAGLGAGSVESGISHHPR